MAKKSLFQKSADKLNRLPGFLRERVTSLLLGNLVPFVGTARLKIEELQWKTADAQGCDLVGISGNSAGDVVAWGGSSFATPLAALESLGLNISDPPTVDLGRC